MPTYPSDAAQQIATTWARTLSGLRDAQLQVAWLREQVQLLGALRAADVLTIVLARAEQREERYASLLLRLSLALADPPLRGVKRAIAYAAETGGQVALARFLGNQVGAAPDGEPASADATGPEVAPAAARAGAIAALELDRDGGEPKLGGLDPAMRRALEGGKGRPLSLGERKSLARRRDRALLMRAVRDPHPDVISVLLDNPALTELDVVRLCAQRPAAPEMLTLVFRHTRWIVRYRIRLALALNPYTPEEITVQLLPHLSELDRRAVARSGDIGPRVRDACAAPEERSLH